MCQVQKGRVFTEAMRETRRAMNLEENSRLRLKRYLEDKGLASPNQKLKPEDVSEIKKLSSEGIKPGAIAERFNVNRSTIYRAIRGLTSHKRNT